MTKMTDWIRKNFWKVFIWFVVIGGLTGVGVAIKGLVEGVRLTG